MTFSSKQCSMTVLYKRLSILRVNDLYRFKLAYASVTTQTVSTIFYNYFTKISKIYSSFNVGRKIMTYPNLASKKNFYSTEDQNYEAKLIAQSKILFRSHLKRRKDLLTITKKFRLVNLKKLVKQ